MIVVVLKHDWNTTETPLEHSWNTTATPLKEQCDCYSTTETSLQHHWNNADSTEAQLEHQWNISGTALKHTCDSIFTPLEHHLIHYCAEFNPTVTGMKSLLHLSKNSYFDTELLIVSATSIKRIIVLITFSQLRRLEIRQLDKKHSQGPSSIFWEDITARKRAPVSSCCYNSIFSSFVRKCSSAAADVSSSKLFLRQVNSL